MKKLRNIIVLFIAIFLVGIYITVITINSSLNKSEQTEEVVKLQKDTAYLLKAESEIKTV